MCPSAASGDRRLLELCASLERWLQEPDPALPTARARLTELLGEEAAQRALAAATTPVSRTA
jgi:hypothetical protein